MELRQQLRVLRSRWWFLLASVLITGGVAFLVSSALPKVYEARVTLLVGQSVQASNPDINQLLASQRLSQTYAELALAGPQLQRVIAKRASTNAGGIRTPSPRGCATRIHPRAPSVEDADPLRAAALANALAEELLAISPAISGVDRDVQDFIDRSLESLQTQIRDTQDEIHG